MIAHRITITHASGRERHVIRHALEVAAERFGEHALEGACAAAFEGAAWGAYMAKAFSEQQRETLAVLASLELSEPD